MKTLRFIKFVFLVLLFVCDTEMLYSQTVEENFINSPPPSSNYVQIKSATTDPLDLVTLKVPPYLWSYGCTNTAAAMIIGYYDQNGYKDLYKGSINGGAAPFNNSFWPQVNQTKNYKNSISASIKGFDNRTENGHVDDFWVCSGCFGNIKYGNGNNPDPHPIISGRTPHMFWVDPCVADYMGTSQDYFNNLDGGTSINTWSDNSKLNDYIAGELISGNGRMKDGIHGLRKYIEDCKYTVVENYSQPIFGFNGTQAGFTFNDFKAEIDAKRPVIIAFKDANNPTGHTVVGIGYSNSSHKICVYTTWSEKHLIMDWGANFTEDNNNMAMKSFSVIKLDPPPFPTGINDVVKIENPPSGTINGQGTIPNNTNLMTPCTNASFYAQFQTDYQPTTYADRFDWKIVLYHSEGEYIYAQQNGLLPNTHTPNGTGQGCVWQPTLSALPAYNWSINYDGNIYGKVRVIVHKDDGVDIDNDFEIGVKRYNEIKDVTYNSNTTINATCTKLNLTNVGITSPASVTFNSNGLGIGINGTFQAQKGSTLTINK